jgi:uncharacterized protein YkwD
MPLCVTPQMREVLQKDFELWKSTYETVQNQAGHYIVTKIRLRLAQEELETARKAETDATSDQAFAAPQRAAAANAKRLAAKKAVQAVEARIKAFEEDVAEDEADLKATIARLRRRRDQQAADAAKAKNACPPPEAPSTGPQPPKDNPDGVAPGHSSVPKTCPDGVLAELNAARADPVAYAARLETLKPYYHGKTFAQPGHPAVMTTEGAAAVDDAITYLRSIKPAPPLALNTTLMGTAARLAIDLGPTGGVGHTGSDGSTMRSRMQDAGLFATIMEEDISLAQATPEAIGRQLIIDDGVASRGHRTAIFSPNLTQVGIACAAHKTYGFMAVIDFTSTPMAR